MPVIRLPQFSGDYGLEAARGNVVGMATNNKFGRNSAVDSGSTEEIWDGSAAYSFPSTADMTSMSQTTDQAAMRGATIEFQGVDTNWDLITQTKALDASDTTTVITLDTAMRRCFRMKVLANVVGDSDIRCHNAGETQDYAIIKAGNNQTLMALYTCPANKRMFVTNYYATVNPGGGAPTTLNIRLWARDNHNSYEKQLKHLKGLNADANAYGEFQHWFDPPYPFTQKTDVYITAETSGAAADVSAGFDFYLEDV